MLENFIYSKQKSLFEEKLNNGEVLDEAIVFIEDTKEIWNHGTYFNCSEVDLSDYTTQEELKNVLSEYIKTTTLTTELAKKQDTITDLSTIRSGAALGSTSVQPADISDMETKTNAAAIYQPIGDYATKSELPAKLSDLTDDVVTGNYLPLSGGTLNGDTAETLRINRTTETPYVSFLSGGNLNGYLGVSSSGVPVYANSAGTMHTIWHTGNLAGDSLTSFMNYYEGSNTATSVASIPVSKRLVVATVSASASFSLASVPAAGREIHVIINNSSTSDISIALPNSGNYICLVDTALAIKAGSYAEVNVISDGTKMYIRSL